MIETKVRPHDLAPYLNTKDSGIPWLRRVPSHWDLVRGKNLLDCIDVRSVTGGEELLTVSSVNGVILRKSASVTMFRAESYIGHKLCWPGDLVINSLWAWAGGLGVSQFHGIVSTAYGVYRPKTDSAFDARYLHELVRSVPFQWELQVRSKGIWKSRLQLTDDSFLSAPFPLPPLAEQQAIGRFLAYVHSRIRTSIHFKQRLIKLLEEQKQVLIYQAVTRGINEECDYRAVGLPWLEDIPKHWALPANSVLFRVKKDLVGERSGDFKLLSLSMRGVIPRDLENAKGKFPASFDTYQKVDAGDLVFCLFDIDETPRTVGIVTEEGMLTGAYTRVRCFDDSNTKFVYYYYSALDDRKCLKPLYSGLRKVIRKGTFLSCKTPMPPSSERAAIVEFIEKVVNESDAAIAHAKQEIAVLREYQARLVADVVTGKLDVREAAASLPERPLEPDTSEETNPALEIGDDMESPDLNADLEEIGA